MKKIKSNLKLVLLIVVIILLILMPKESRLGEVYKLVYFHVPITFITLSSVIALPFLSLKADENLIKSFALAMFIFAIIHLLLSTIFMKLAWGDIIILEPRFIFSSALLTFIALETIVTFIELKVAKIFSFLILAVIVSLYILIISPSQFQLHPAYVDMNYFAIPFVLTFPLILLLYIDMIKIFRDIFKEVKESQKKHQEQI